MPSTKFRNYIYRAALPIFGPNANPKAEYASYGHPLSFQDDFFRFLRKHHVLGSALLLSDSEKESELYVSHPGLAHFSGRKVFFRTASITKIATALLAMKMAEIGLLDQDAPLCSDHSFFSQFPEIRMLTVRQLLSHTSGLKDPPNLDLLLSERATLYDALKSSSFDPSGLYFHYSNLGYGLIGSLAECIYDLPISEIMRREIFDPLHMNATLDPFSLVENSIMPVNRVFPFRSGKDIRIPSVSEYDYNRTEPFYHYGLTSGGMYSDAGSVLKLLNCIKNDGEGFIGAEYIRMMRTKHADYGKTAPDLSYGLGLLLIHNSGISDSPVIGHQGFAYGCVNGAFFDCETGNIFIFLNGGCSEARIGRLGLSNFDLMKWAFRKEIPSWKK